MQVCSRFVAYDTHRSQGTYVISDTLNIPVGTDMIGEMWSQILVKGSVFNDQNIPNVALKFGNVGDVGTLRVSNMLVRFVLYVSVPTKRVDLASYSTFAGSIGAIAMEINVQESCQGSVGFWDTVCGFLFCMNFQLIVYTSMFAWVDQLGPISPRHNVKSYKGTAWSVARIS